MVSFIYMFLSYFLLCIIFIAIIVVAVMLGKKLRDIKEQKSAAVSQADPAAEEHRV